MGPVADGQDILDALQEPVTAFPEGFVGSAEGQVVPSVMSEASTIWPSAVTAPPALGQARPGERCAGTRTQGTLGDAAAPATPVVVVRRPRPALPTCVEHFRTVRAALTTVGRRPRG
jgi:hypothetical protein